MKYSILILSLVMYCTLNADAANIASGTSLVIKNHIDSIKPTYKTGKQLINSHTPTVNKNTNNFFPVINFINNRIEFQGQLGLSKQGRAIPAYYFPGTGTMKAIVIGGVHGSELSSIEIAKKLVKNLQSASGIYYNLVVIPCLFPDNEVAAVKYPDGKKKLYNTGRYTSKNAIDPNRQMPAPGKAYDKLEPLDYLGRSIETENQLLLQLIEEYRPDRIINLHAIREIKNAGIFADPRTDFKGFALGYETDSSLAISMAKYIYERGGNVAGNHLDDQPTALYHHDPAIVPERELQLRNLEGSKLPDARGQGVSLGSWASTAVCDTINISRSRAAMRLITIEFPGYKRPADYEQRNDQVYYSQLIGLYTEAIQNIFLGPQFPEPEIAGCDCKGKLSSSPIYLTDNN